MQWFQTTKHLNGFVPQGRFSPLNISSKIPEFVIQTPPRIKDFMPLYAISSLIHHLIQIQYSIFPFSLIPLFSDHESKVFSIGDGCCQRKQVWHHLQTQPREIDQELQQVWHNWENWRISQLQRWALSKVPVNHQVFYHHIRTLSYNSLITSLKLMVNRQANPMKSNNP